LSKSVGSKARPTPAGSRRIVEQLEESQDISRELLETATQGILLIDIEERIVRANEAACKMFGYTRPELVGKKLGMLVPANIRKMHSRHVAGYFDKPRRRAMGVGMDLTARSKDGSQIPVEISLSHVLMDGNPLAVAFISDISLRKQSEREIADHRERLQQLTKRLITAAEDETRRWARELHDVFSQRLASISMSLDRLNRDQPEGGPYRAVEADVRSLAHDVQRM
jgi:PAS domain S-box-containing protein